MLNVIKDVEKLDHSDVASGTVSHPATAVAHLGIYPKERKTYIHTVTQ